VDIQALLPFDSFVSLEAKFKLFNLNISETQTSIDDAIAMILDSLSILNQKKNLSDI